MPILDHLLWAVPDLDQAIDHFEQLTGVRPAFGGEHPGRGTRNALVSLGPRQYIELIGPDPAQPESTRESGVARAVAHARVPALITFAVAHNDLEGLGAAATARDWPFQGPVPGSRQQPDGGLLRWRLGHTAGTRFGLYAPFYIDWQDSPHPAASAPGGLELVDFEVRHPDANGLAALFSDLGVEPRPQHQATPELRATLRTPRGTTVVLSSQAT